MLRLSQVGMYALVAGLLITSGASAATITDVYQEQFDPTVTDYAIYGYGSVATLLSWSNVGSNHLFDANGHPTANYAPPASAANPSWLDFQALSNGSSGGSGGSGVTNPDTQFQHTYTLGNNNKQDWTMDFSILIFDPKYTGSGLEIELMGSKAGSETYKAVTLTADQVKAGEMLTWNVVAAGDETVAVRTTSVGQDEYAAGYFIDTANPGTPEPATLALLGLGLGVSLVRRFRRQ